MSFDSTLIITTQSAYGMKKIHAFALVKSTAKSDTRYLGKASKTAKKNHTTHQKAKPRCSPRQRRMSRVILHHQIAYRDDFLQPHDHLAEDIAQHDGVTGAILPFPCFSVGG